MLVTFRSTATDPVLMFGDTAAPLLRMMGASGKVPGALKAEDVPGALQQLQSALDQLETETAAPPAMNEDWSAKDEEEEEKPQEPPVQLAVRALPLVNLLKRAAAAGAEVIWE